MSWFAFAVLFLLQLQLSLTLFRGTDAADEGLESVETGTEHAPTSLVPDPNGYVAYCPCMGKLYVVFLFRQQRRSSLHILCIPPIQVKKKPWYDVWRYRKVWESGRSILRSTWIFQSFKSYTNSTALDWIRSLSSWICKLRINIIVVLFITYYIELGRIRNPRWRNEIKKTERILHSLKSWFYGAPKIG